MSMNYDIESDNNAHHTQLLAYISRRSLSILLLYSFFHLFWNTHDSESNDGNEDDKDCGVIFKQPIVRHPNIKY